MDESLTTVEKVIKLNYLLTAKDSALLEKEFQHIADFYSFAGVEISYPRFRVYERTRHAEDKIIQHALTHYQITG
ncbi:unnamed protein product [Peronospora farinosa]|uniref:Uncharacterized protein n=1 Tax=Peronospora farinosa TaxID=134698 RepID=A0ABN8CEE4_9STRA|nr:unnamed protein product [Peronospora farinosa]